MYVHNRHKISVRYLSHWIKYQMTSGHGPRKPWTWAGLRPIPTLWLDQPPLGMSKKTDCLKRRACGTPRSSSGALTLLNMAWTSLKLREAAPSNTRAGPLDSHLENQPFMKSKTVPKPQNHGATNSTIAEESFPGDVTQPSQVSTREQPKEHEPTTWNPKQRTHAGKRNQLRACFKPIQASTNWIPNPD